MSSFREVVDSIASRARVRHAQAAIRGVHGRGAARWLADVAGISPRTARRWLSGDYPRSRSGNVVEAAAAAAAATGMVAVMVAAATGMDVGEVEVEYDGIPQGTRQIGQIGVDASNAGYIQQAATDLAAGYLEGAADAFSRAVICGYEPGLEETLYITDYRDGVELFE